MKKQSIKTIIDKKTYGDEYEVAIMQFCLDLYKKMMAKYQAGKLEHGGKPHKLDCGKEINLEVLDILNYHVISLVNAKKKVPREKGKKK